MLGPQRLFVTAWGRLSVFHQHEFAAGLIDLRIQNPATIWRNSQAAGASGQVDNSFKFATDLIRPLPKSRNWMEEPGYANTRAWAAFCIGTKYKPLGTMAKLR